MLGEGYTCSECRFWLPDETVDTGGFCRSQGKPYFTVYGDQDACVRFSAVELVPEQYARDYAAQLFREQEELVKAMGKPRYFTWENAEKVLDKAVPMSYNGFQEQAPRPRSADRVSAE